MSLRTLQRRREDEEGRALSPEQSGQAWTFAGILGRATEVLGSRKEALDRRQHPALALDGRCPMDLLRTPAGADPVDNHLTRIAYGVYT